VEPVPVVVPRRRGGRFLRGARGEPVPPVPGGSRRPGLRRIQRHRRGTRAQPPGRDHRPVEGRPVDTGRCGPRQPARHADDPAHPPARGRARSQAQSRGQLTSRAMPDKITMQADGTLSVPDEPVIPYVEGDGTGVDIWPAAQLVMDAAAAKHGKSIAWKEVLAGEKAFNATGSWLPDETVAAFREYLIGIKGPLTTPVGGGIRSLNVALRQILDLYVCLRPVRWFPGVPSPVKHPELVDMVIFRENTEDIYAGLEVEEGTPEAKKLIALLKENFGWNIREDSGVGIKPVSETGSKRLIRAALQYAVEHDRKGVALVHKGNIQKFTEGAFRNWGYELVREEFSDVAVGWDDCDGKPGDKILVKDNIADITLQQVLTRPDDFDVVATTNLNGD